MIRAKIVNITIDANTDIRAISPFSFLLNNFFKAITLLVKRVVSYLLIDWGFVALLFAPFGTNYSISSAFE